MKIVITEKVYTKKKFLSIVKALVFVIQHIILVLDINKLHFLTLITYIIF